MLSILNTKQRLPLICVVALMVCAGPSTAEDWISFGDPASALNPWPYEESTHVDDLEFFPVRREGRLDACGLEFTLASRDWAYRNNAAFIATGSVTLFAFPQWKGRTALALKLTVMDTEPRAGILWGRRSPVAFAYLSMGSESVNSLVLAPHTTEIESEPDSQSFLAWEPEALALMNGLLDASVIRVWFSREKGETDLELPIRLSDFENQKRAFRMCLYEVAGRVIRDIAEEMDMDLPPR